METEKTCQDKEPRTIRQKRGGKGALEFVDNRKGGIRQATGSVHTMAYTQGKDIHVAPGQEQHLPHEAWHVAQQVTGRVEPTTETEDGQ